MPINGGDIYDIRQGMITAPAGCGKTQLILSALQVHEKPKPVLVLTHTNAGVAAIKSRMQRMGISPKCCKVVTIDGFCMRIASTFPRRSAINPVALLLSNASEDYPTIRSAALRLLRERHIDDIIGASYCHLIVDEYQDCNLVQHELVVELARTLPTCLLGDPLQAIFDFAGPGVEWDARVCSDFPVVAELETPWRWIRAGAQELGEWILSCRPALIANNPIDIRQSPDSVNWVELTNNPTENAQKLRTAASIRGDVNDGVLIIGDSRNTIGRQQFASTVIGASTVEAVDLRDLIAFGQAFNPLHADALNHLLTFAHGLITGVSVTDILSRARTLRGGRARVDANVSEAAVLEFLENPNMRGAIKILRELPSVAPRRIYRPHIYHPAIKAMEMAASGSRTFPEACLIVREQNRALGRTLPRRAVGSTLLLKGLEAEIAVLLNAGELNSKNLYVAMSRGAKKVVFCSPSPLLNTQNVPRRA